MEHTLLIAGAMNNETDASLWNEEDGFFYDHLRRPDGSRVPVPTRTMVGLTPMFAVAAAPMSLIEQFPDFVRRLDWFRAHRPDLADKVAVLTPTEAQGTRRTDTS